MMHNDSVEKIIQRYFSTVSKESFSFKGVDYHPKVLRVSPLLLRDYTCPAGCGGCCFKFTLDYLPSSPRPKGCKPRQVEVNEKSFTIYTDAQEENEGNRCKHLIKEDGRCGIYLKRPFTCDFELIRTLQNLDDPNRPNQLTQKLFGRGWSYQRVDGGKGALCEMTGVTQKSIEEVVRKLHLLKEWTDYFEIATWLPEIIRGIKSGRLSQGPMVFKPGTRKGLVY